jgi:hypothetical protein
MKQTLFESVCGEVGFGKIGLDGMLGYHNGQVFLPPQYHHWKTISAHAPSRIQININKPMEICGGLDGSTERLFRGNPVTFYVNEWRIGECIGAWDVTRSLILPPGEYLLSVDLSGKKDSCHSLWIGRSIDKEIATPENSVFLSVDTHGAQSSYSAIMRNTATKNGISIVFLDEGESWKGFYHHKIEKMERTLQKYQEEGKQFAFIVDARDIAFVDPLLFMLAKFNALQEGKIVYNTDGLGYSYPCGQLWYKKSYRQITGHFLTFLNAGVLAGPIPVFLKAMTICRKIRTALIEGKPWAGIMEHHYRDHRDWSHDDDQYLYQLCQMYHPEFFTPDIEKRFCVHLKGYPKKNWRNDFEFRDPCCTGSASILHIPDLAGTEFWKEWVTYEGNFPVLEMKSLDIGYRRPGYGMVTIGQAPDFGGRQIQESFHESDKTINAHADSFLEVNVKEEVQIAGAIHETVSNKMKQIKASFHLDDATLGEVTFAGVRTPFVPLYPGKHTLSIRAVSSNKGCHSFWIVRENHKK